jgi:hypothetical protein
MTSKQRAPGEAPAETPDDLDENPGIGQSKGLFARAGSEGAELIAGENTVEGDVENDAALGQGADTGDVGRENP